MAKRDSVTIRFTEGQEVFRFVWPPSLPRLISGPISISRYIRKRRNPGALCFYLASIYQEERWRGLRNLERIFCRPDPEFMAEVRARVYSPTRPTEALASR